eukprot:gnl/TRDRNA2_/TRDRNA2_136903_c0_seq1.p1 gnl/TRDRNA2_/TRDRNA2_136903_c0~~gnl/TRDRNA2_/TRDRNA2_136903_c0_seq1.p1  ORF type:complete len:435 (-),score=52.71 gnl/TRDRNA2_/TRDRNA2_136903_c0_seq1:229-1533(-)
MNRHMYLVYLTLLSSLLYSGDIFGWAPMQRQLEQDGIFLEACGSQEVKVTTCPLRTAKINMVYTAGVLMQSLCGLPVGILLDKLGPQVMVAAGGLINISGYLLFGLCTGELVIFGYSLIALGGMCMFLSAFHVAKFIPEHRNAFMSGISCGMDASSVVFPALKLVLDAGTSRGDVFAAFAVFTAFYTLAIYAAWSASSRCRSCGEGASGEALLETNPGSSSTDMDVQCVSKLPLSQQLRTLEFGFVLVFCFVNLTRSNMFLGLVKNCLVEFGDEQETPTLLYTTITMWCVPAGIVFVPIVERILSKGGFVRAIDLVHASGMVYTVLQLIDVLPLQVVTAVIYTFYRALFFSVLAAFNFTIFGPDTFGTVAGLMYTFCSLAQPMQIAAVYFTEKAWNGDYRLLNAVLLCSLVLPWLASIKLRSKSKEPSVVGEGS